MFHIFHCKNILVSECTTRNTRTAYLDLKPCRERGHLAAIVNEEDLLLTTKSCREAIHVPARSLDALDTLETEDRLQNLAGRL
jgi:hypothetical protein